MKTVKAHLQEVITLTVCLTIAAALWAVRAAVPLTKFAASAAVFVVLLLVEDRLHRNPTGQLLGVAFGAGSIGYVIAARRRAPLWVLAAAMAAGCLTAVAALAALDLWADTLTATLCVIALAGAAGLTKSATARQVKVTPLLWGPLCGCVISGTLTVVQLID